jgi:hypothetical protein
MFKYKYVIWSPPFSINSGGILCLHYLCHLLNKLYFDAYIYYTNNTSYVNHYGLDINIWPNNHILDDKTIIIYPEIVDNNPLNAKNIVRWLLHKPGFWTGRINYGSDDLIVAYGKHMGGGLYTITDQQLLNIVYIMNNIYFNLDLPRENVCFSVRKCKKYSKSHPENSICIDNKSHQDISYIFNKCHTFISYDPYSYYSVYAALCGCDSIIIPEYGVSKEQWRPDIKDTYGLAYGFDDIEYARSTRNLLIDDINNREKNDMNTVKKFTELCESYFKE